MTDRSDANIINKKDCNPVDIYLGVSFAEDSAAYLCVKHTIALSTKSVVFNLF